MKFFTLLTYLLSSAIILAERPSEFFGGHQQLDIAQLEKDLGKKFSTPFPSKKFDIDYFNKGDLLSRPVQAGILWATCPFVVSGAISFALGEGKKVGELSLSNEVTLDLTKEQAVSRLSIRAYLDKNWPEKPIVISRNDDESAADFFTRARKLAQALAEQSDTPKLNRQRIALAIEVAQAAAKQTPLSK